MRFLIFLMEHKTFVNKTGEETVSSYLKMTSSESY